MTVIYSLNWESSNVFGRFSTITKGEERALLPSGFNRCPPPKGQRVTLHGGRPPLFWYRPPGKSMLDFFATYFLLRMNLQLPRDQSVKDQISPQIVVWVWACIKAAYTDSYKATKDTARDRSRYATINRVLGGGNFYWGCMNLWLKNKDLMRRPQPRVKPTNIYHAV